MPTYNAKPNEIKRRWYIVDAAGATLGRTATKVATILQGKNKPVYTPHVDTGDYVVVVNADKIMLSGNKLDAKLYYRHSGWVGGLVSKSARELMASKPEEVFKMAVKGMLPKTVLGKAMFKKLKVHKGPGPAHGYQAQKAEALELN
jgi:large subunit ribosomal protein L13